MAKIQLALDRLTIEECMHIAEQSSPYIDYIEVGTGVIKEYGMHVVREMRKRFLDKVLVADMKTCDAGRAEAIQAFDAGADVTTVMGYAPIRTVKEMLTVAETFNGRVMVDLLGVTDTARIQALYNIGVRMFNIHMGIDLQQDNAWSSDDFLILKELQDIELVVSGGIKASTVPLLMKHSPDLLIVGGAITSQDDPATAAEAIYKEVQRFA